MYSSLPGSISIDAGRALYAKFFNDGKFAASIDRVFSEWPISCEQFLTDTSTPFNRIAWLGQAACCISEGLPRVCRGGYKLLTESMQDESDGIAEKRIGEFEIQYSQKSGRLHCEMEEAWISGRNPRGGSGSVDERELGTVIQGYLPGFAFK